MKEKLVQEYNNRLSKESPTKVLEFFLKKYSGKIAFASSLGAEDQVLTHMILPIDPSVKIFTLHHQATDLCVNCYTSLALFDR